MPCGSSASGKTHGSLPLSPPGLWEGLTVSLLTLFLAWYLPLRHVLHNSGKSVTVRIGIQVQHITDCLPILFVVNHHPVIGVPCDKVAKCVAVHQLPPTDDRHAMTDFFNFLHVVCRDEHCDTGSGQILQHVAHEFSRVRIQIGRGFVEIQNFWVVKQFPGKQQLLSHPLRITADQHVCRLVKLQPDQYIINRASRSSVQIGEQFQILTTSELFDMVFAVGNVAERSA